MGQIGQAVNQLDQTTQQNAALVEETPPPPRAWKARPAAWCRRWPCSNWPRRRSEALLAR
jgi:hypothetical protein